MKSFSYEIDLPAAEGLGRRFSYEDGFSSRKDATAAMMEDIKRAPENSTAVVYRRYQDGEMTSQQRFVKKTVIQPV